ncbi:GIY-YIG nuclease family protein [Verrucomicrobiaceae bacterium N1E253]|uniref:GIY-YIG nuclease family protein n=1 Tax=Oceaniferula marina TaxID=2748318 RepID=A0A851GHY0_9BACT|nr:GIY-YIG nuclease family protein [Oceaniferula marina]NWK56502.1 GIY-YIG nuclease family protein [Oceaniferula marina]
MKIVYILVNRMNRRFIGTTEDVEAEVRSHNKGEFKGTKAFKPWRLEWESNPISVNEAARLETKLRHHKTNAPMLQQIMNEHEFPKPKF